MTTTTGGGGVGLMITIGRVLVFWNVTPSSTGVNLVLPARNSGRMASRRSARNAGEGRASTNAATASGSLGRAVKPAGSMTRASGWKLA